MKRFREVIAWNLQPSMKSYLRTSFGSIFSSRLTEQLAQQLPAGALSHLPSTNSITPSVVSRLPAVLRQGFELAFSNALTGMFIYAVPIIGVAFLLLLTLREVPLRGSEVRQPSAAGANRAGANHAGARGRHRETEAGRLGKRAHQERGAP